MHSACRNQWSVIRNARCDQGAGLLLPETGDTCVALPDGPIPVDGCGVGADGAGGVTLGEAGCAPVAAATLAACVCGTVVAGALMVAGPPPFGEGDAAGDPTPANAGTTAGVGAAVVPGAVVPGGVTVVLSGEAV